VGEERPIVFQTAHGPRWSQSPLAQQLCNGECALCSVTHLAIRKGHKIKRSVR